MIDRLAVLIRSSRLHTQNSVRPPNHKIDRFEIRISLSRNWFHSSIGATAARPNNDIANQMRTQTGHQNSIEHFNLRRDRQNWPNSVSIQLIAILNIWKINHNGMGSVAADPLKLCVVQTSMAYAILSVIKSNENIYQCWRNSIAWVA